MHRPPAAHTVDPGASSVNEASGRRLVLLVSGLALTLGMAFVWLHVAGPSDGARLEPGQQAWTHEGVVVSLLDSRSGELEPGDVVVAVEGRSMPVWWDGLFALGVPHTQRQVGQTLTYTVLRGGYRLSVPVTLRLYPWRGLLRKDWSLLLYFLVFAVVGTYVFIRRPQDRTTTILFLSTSMLLAANTVWSIGMQVSDITGGVGFWLASTMALVVNPVCWAAFLHFVLRFPRVHPILRGRRWLVPVLYFWPFPCLLTYFAIVRAMLPGTLDWIAPWGPDSNAVILVYGALIVLVLGSNVRAHLDAVSQQQIRWIVFAGLVSVGSDLLLWILPSSVLGHPLITLDALGLLLLPIPLALAIAILRYHVFDIDIIINKTLVYGTLTAILAAVYFGTVIGAQVIAQRLTGQAGLPPVVTVASTLLCVVLFTPLRRRLQSVIDRRFYRRKYDAARTLAAFGETLRGETNLSELSERLTAVVEETMHPARVSLWLRALPRARDGERVL